MSVVASHAEDWPRFRGPNGTGVGDIAALPAELGAGPNVVWKTTQKDAAIAALEALKIVAR